MHGPLGLTWNAICLPHGSEPYLQGSGKVNEQGRLDIKIIINLELYLPSLIKDIDTEIFSYHKKTTVWVRCLVATGTLSLRTGATIGSMWGMWRTGRALLKRMVTTQP